MNAKNIVSGKQYVVAALGEAGQKTVWFVSNPYRFLTPEQFYETIKSSSQEFFYIHDVPEDFVEVPGLLVKKYFSPLEAVPWTPSGHDSTRYQDIVYRFYVTFTNSNRERASVSAWYILSVDQLDEFIKDSGYERM